MADPDASCLFCHFASGERHAEIVLRDDTCVAFLDHRPLFPGHTLLVPRRHVETLVDLPEELVAPLFGAARRLARAVRDALDAEGSFVAMNNRVSQSVPHLHVHVVPRRKGDGLRGFFWPRQRYTDEAHVATTRDAIRHALTSGDSPQLNAPR